MRRGSCGGKEIVLFVLVSVCLPLLSLTRAIKIHSVNKRKPGSSSDREDHDEDRFRNQNPSRAWEENISVFDKQVWNIENETSLTVLSTYVSAFFRPVRVAFTRVATDAACILQEIRPVRDMWDGLLEAMPLFWKGYYNGFESLLDLSHKGMMENGPFGFIIGLMVGSLHFATMTATGAMAGFYQGVKGIERTLEAIRASRQGKTWDKRLRQWIYYNLDTESQSVLSDKPGESSTQPRKRHLRRRVKESTFYDILNLPVDANTTEIKKAYYQLALSIHPDKSEDLSSEEQFRQLNSIYKTLMNEDTRAMYDQHGSCYVTQMTLNSDSNAEVDPFIFFSTLFGSHMVELYVGDLAIASMVDNILLLTKRANPHVKAKSRGFWQESDQQVRRQLRIASHLRHRIESFVNGEVTLDGFRASCRIEADALTTSLQHPYRSEYFLLGISSGLMAETCEHLMAEWARPFLASFFDVTSLAQNIRVDRDLDRAVRGAMMKYNRQSSQAGYDLIEQNEETEDHLGENCKLDEDGKDLNSLLRAMASNKMWKIMMQFNVYDVSRTVRDATRRVLDDCGANHDLKVKKARALHALAREFHGAFQRQSKDKSLDDIQLDAEELHKAVKAALLEAIVEDDPNK